MQPYVLFRDTRTGMVYRVAADGQSKVRVGGVALYVDQLNLTRQGFNGDVTEDETIIDPWLDSVPTNG